MKYFVKVGNGKRIKAFSYADASKLAQRIGGKVIAVPMGR